MADWAVLTVGMLTTLLLTGGLACTVWAFGRAEARAAKIRDERRVGGARPEDRKRAV